MYCTWEVVATILMCTVYSSMRFSGQWTVGLLIVYDGEPVLRMFNHHHLAVDMPSTYSSSTPALQ